MSPPLLLLALATLTADAGAPRPDAAVPAPAPVSAPAALEEKRVLEKVLALVEGQPLLLSEVEFEARVDGIRIGAVLAAFAPLTQEDVAVALTSSIHLRLVLAKADRLRSFVDLDEAEVRRARTIFAARLGGEDQVQRFLTTWEESEAHLVAHLRRRLRALRFLEQQTGLTAKTVTEEEVQRYLEDLPSSDPARTLTRSELREQVKRERNRSHEARYLEELRSRADVRLLGVPGPRP
jgi:hypothetical protein